MPALNASPLLFTRRRRGFSLIELLTTIVIVAMLVVLSLVFVPSYINWAQQTADQRTLTILNDALTRYKNEGGNVSALTTGANVGNLISVMQTGITWLGFKHSFLQSGKTYPARSLSTNGSGSTFYFNTYNTYSITGSGGTVTHGVATFSSVGPATWTVPTGITTVEVLVVAGGGAGGTDTGGGGGAGGVIHQTSYSVTPGANISITVGAGGSGDGVSGSNSIFGSLTAVGGGGGGCNEGVERPWGTNGGSGGGASYSSYFGAAGTGTSGQGNAGGVATAWNTNYGCGGGGGAGGSGTNGTSTTGGSGGAGIAVSITGTSVYYGGGGAGGTYSGGTPGVGGTGGGAGPTGQGTNGLGGGGGGSCNNTNTQGNGGSGVVIIKY